MNGPGKVFLEPLPGSTNYMSAYDQYGKLLRTRGQEDKDAAPEGEQKALEEGKQDEAQPGEQDLEKLDAAAVAEKEATEATKKQLSREERSKSSIPPETQFDFYPFPMNQQFKSQPVLSEELRDAIWKRVMRDGVSLPTVSVEFGVSNERVGAVVRLMQMEKEWIAQVSLRYFLLPSATQCNDETQKKFD